MENMRFLEFAVSENVREHRKNACERPIIRYFSSTNGSVKNGKQIFLNLHEFTVPENARICKENACERQNIGQFSER